MSSDPNISLSPLAGEGRRAAASLHLPNEISIRVSALSKCYHIYDRPQDRLKQSIFPRLQRLAGRPPKQYHREFWALKDVSFEMKRGETIGIVGRNGSGKSTLLQLICGTLTPTSGTVETSGRVAALLELGSGFNPEFTGRENVYMNAAVLGLTREEVDTRFDSIAAFADIGQFIDQPVKAYSSGMVLRLAFSVAINVDPQILVVDEALSVGDELFQRKCFSRIESIKEAGATILFVSHSGATVIELCNRAMLLDAGERLTIGAPKRIVGQYQKLLYAPHENQEAIRAAIRTSTFDSPERNDDAAIAAKKSTLAHTKQVLSFDDEAEELYDPHLKPQSTVAYESRGAAIESPEILTLSGKRVNCLVSGRMYRYTYRVRFDRSATNVRFGMLIKSLSGVELGGAVSAPTGVDAIPFVAAGTIAHVEFPFSASLNPGTYFLNAGVLGAIDSTEIFLHRVLDACMFRILPDPGRISTGMVDFHVEPEFSYSVIAVTA